MGLYENLSDDPVSMMTLRVPALATAAESCAEVVQRMRNRRLGCALIVDADHKPVGIFTERMLVQLLMDRPAALSDPIEQRMSQSVPTVGLDEPVARVLDAMELKNTRFVCVVDGEGRVVGLTGQKGLMEFVADHFPQHVMVQRLGVRAPQQKEGA